RAGLQRRGVSVAIVGESTSFRCRPPSSPDFADARSGLRLSRRSIGTTQAVMMKHALLLVLAAVAAAMGGAGPATAQAYPARPVTIIVPFTAGGTSDVFARIVGEHMARTLGQQLVIENVVGAGGTTGSTRAMRANPDGYTLVLGNMGTHAASVALHPGLA